MAKTVTIDNLSWDATAEIQEWKIAVEESGWELPEGATLIKEKQEAKSYKIVGYETKYRTEEYQEKMKEAAQINDPQERADRELLLQQQSQAQQKQPLL